MVKCDRCDKEVEESGPEDKGWMSVQRKRNASSLWEHLCPKCGPELDSFMKGATNG